MRKKSLIGHSHDFLSVIDFAGRDERYRHGQTLWLCECICGRRKIYSYQRYLKNKSCGCMKPDFSRKQMLRHGRSKSKTYNVWLLMRRRCSHKSLPGYENYGGRGIQVCERWESFRNFYADMGERPEGLTLDRIDVDGGYSPENCRWVGRDVQARNKRNNRLLTFNGKTQCSAAWAEEIGVKPYVICHRLKRGWTLERTLTTKCRA